MFSKKYLLLFCVAGLWACVDGKLDLSEFLSGTKSGEGSEAGGTPGGTPGGGDPGGGDPGGGTPGGSGGIQTIIPPENWGLNGDGEPVHPNTTAKDGVGVDADGNLVLNQQKTTLSHHMWLADTANDMVSKFDVNTGKEVARYRSVTPLTCAAGQSPEQKNCTAFTISAGTRHHPSRTAIDGDGNAWVANRGFGGLNSVTKIAGDERFCVDRNGNGKIDTSRDLNASGAIELAEALALGEDECILFTTRVCTGSYGARALAIDAAGDVWVGCYTNQTVYQLDSKNGQIKRGPIALGLPPYGAIVDSRQNLWLTTLGTGGLQGVNTRTGEVLNKEAGNPKPITSTGFGRCYAYGLAVDGQDRVWMSGGCIYNHYAAANKWRRCYEVDRTGIVVDQDYNVYSTTGSSLVRQRWDEGTSKCNAVSTTATSVAGLKGVGLAKVEGLDKDDPPWPWAVGGTQAARLDLKTGAILRTRAATGHSPTYYTYSDFTGYQMRTFTLQKGSYKQVLKGCTSYSSWKSLSWNAELPQGARVDVYVRMSNTLEGLSTAVRHGPLEKVEGNLSSVQRLVGESNFVQLEFELLPSIDSKVSPVLRGYEVTWACDTPSTPVG